MMLCDIWESMQVGHLEMEIRDHEEIYTFKMTALCQDWFNLQYLYVKYITNQFMNLNCCSISHGNELYIINKTVDLDMYIIQRISVNCDISYSHQNLLDTVAVVSSIGLNSAQMSLHPCMYAKANICWRRMHHDSGTHINYETSRLYVSDTAEQTIWYSTKSCWDVKKIN